MSDQITIEPITNPSDFAQAFYSTSEAFARQVKDALWISMSPGWDTPSGQAAGAASFEKRWKAIKTNKDGNPNTVFLKASLPVADSDGVEKPRVVGLAIWQQASFVEGYGDAPPETLPDSALEKVDERTKRFAQQMFRSLWKRRREVVNEKKEREADPPATFVLDLCAVDPAYQRRGIAGRLVQWGIDEARRRGGLECTTEASSMGRGVYVKLGFRDEGVGDIEFEVDKEFEGWAKPPNVFLRTGA